MLSLPGAALGTAGTVQPRWFVPSTAGRSLLRAGEQQLGLGWEERAAEVEVQPWPRSSSWPAACESVLRRAQRCHRWSCTRLEFPVAVATEIAASPFPFCANPPSFFSFFFIFFPHKPHCIPVFSKGSKQAEKDLGLCLRLLLGHHPQRWDLQTRVCGSRTVLSDLRESRIQSLLSLGSVTGGSEPIQHGEK